MRTILKGKIENGVKIGVYLTFSKSDDVSFLKRVANVIQEHLFLQEHLFAIGTTGANASTQPSSPVDPNAALRTVNSFIICASSFDHLDRARLLSGSKFLGRIVSAKDDLDARQWVAGVLDLGVHPYDGDALWDVVRKSVRSSADPFVPPTGSRSADEMLAEARVHLNRLTPQQAYDELRGSMIDAPAFLVDIRPAAQRDMEGGIGGSLIIERTELEWRFDPRSDSRLAIVDRYDVRVIVFCQEGYSSSLAAFSLQLLGLYNATDIIGGFAAWRAAGLPVDAPSIPQYRRR
ncbi:hypothetical protein AMATHDRAFT_177486 [Amanita thiersii Skay4041]|uniref:Rhodanese domain-containing protein n=1 Tax=Amanita thiersii Skay4041 TaxID=703135 RepID=A0A2A9NR69_9AGAR|nr:hypothetical protein AMATHDRAFT_177486 [Amanita thiersii Skay4041]